MASLRPVGGPGRGMYSVSGPMARAGGRYCPRGLVHTLSKGILCYILYIDKWRDT